MINFVTDGSGAFIKRDNPMKHFLKLLKRLHRMPKQALPLIRECSGTGKDESQMTLFKAY
jgi:hypothetical protein